MTDLLKECLWKQFGASIDMLENAIRLCPDEFLAFNRKFFFMTYHSLIFLDYYLTIPPINFSSPLPFTIKEWNEVPVEAMDDIIPDRYYSKEELLGYLKLSRTRCQILISGLTEEKLNERFIEEPGSGTKNYSVLEILLYNMRHVQHHAAQLNLLLRQGIKDAPKWVSRAEDAND
jgi:hypothetical protein